MMSISQVFPLPFIRMGLVKFLKFLVLTCAYKSRQDFTEVLKCSISLYIVAIQLEYVTRMYCTLCSFCTWWYYRYYLAYSIVSIIMEVWNQEVRIVLICCSIIQNVRYSFGAKSHSWICFCRTLLQL